MSHRTALSLVLTWHDAARFADWPSEKVLEQYVASRDEAAFRELLRRHAPHVWAVCRHELRSPDLADDAFQTTFVALVRKAHQVRQPGSLAGWLDRTARRAAGEIRRGAARRAKVEAAMPAPPDPADLAAAARAEAVRDAVAELPDRYRLPVTYRYLTGLSAAEVARVLGDPEETIRTRLKRGVELLKQKLGGKGLGIGVGTAGGTVSVESALTAAAETVPQTVLVATAEAVQALPVKRGLLAAAAAVVTYKRAVMGMAALAAAMTGALVSTPGPRTGMGPISPTTKDSPMRGSPLLALAAALGLTPTAPAQTFTNVVNTSIPITGGTGNYTSMGAGPISGTTMAFRGGGNNNQTGIYTVSTLGGLPAVIADINTPIPNGTGTFANFHSNGYNSPYAISGPNVAFKGENGVQPGVLQQGVYYGSGPGSLIRIADRNTLVPGSTNTFTDFNEGGGVCLSGTTIIFAASPTIGITGIYAGSTSGGPLIRILDQSTPIPNGTGNFQLANRLHTSEGTIVFNGGGTIDRGVYTISTTGGPATRIVDLNTPVPGGGGNFTTFNWVVSISGATVVFSDLGSAGGPTGGHGVYTAPATGGAITLIANPNTPIPGGTGNFTGFGNVAINGSLVSFIGSGANGQQGLFTTQSSGGSITKIVAKGDMLDGRTVNSFGIGAYISDSSVYTFQVTFTDGSIAVYTFTPVPEPAGVLAVSSITGAAFVVVLRKMLGGM